MKLLFNSDNFRVKDDFVNEKNEFEKSEKEFRHQRQSQTPFFQLKFDEINLQKKFYFNKDQFSIEFITFFKKKGQSFMNEIQYPSEKKGSTVHYEEL